MPSMVNRLSHQPWWLRGRLVYFPFNHVKVSDLILSTICWRELFLLLKTLLFLSFQIYYTVANQITCKMERFDLAAPPIKLNRIKWLDASKGITEEIPSHLRIWFQTDPKKLQCNNKWEDVSTAPHRPTQDWASMSITWRRQRLSLVGSLSRNRRQANNTTFKTNFCVFLSLFLRNVHTRISTLFLI